MENSITTNPRGVVAAYFPHRSKAEDAVHDLRAAGFSANRVGIAARAGSPAPESEAFSGPSAREIANQQEAEREMAHNPGLGNEFIAGDLPSASIAGPESGETSEESAWDRVVDFFHGNHARHDRKLANLRRNEDLRVPEAAELNASGAPGIVPTPLDSDPGGDSSYVYDPEDFHRSLSAVEVPEVHSRYFGRRLEQEESGVIVTVAAEDRASEARAILERNGGDTGTEAGSYDQTSGGNPIEGSRRIQLLGEVARVHKERISRGDVRLRKEAVTETQTIQVPVTREELVIERSPASGGLPAQSRIGEQGELRIPLSEERATVDKDTVVREEISIGKRTVSDVQQFEETLRHEELKVDKENRRAG